jgi:hypothetical protein
MMQAHALRTVNDAFDDAVPEADETLLTILAERVQRGERPTSSELLAEAQNRDASTFAKWSPRGVSSRLRNYGLKAHKIDNRRVYKNAKSQLLAVQASYNLPLGFPETPLPVKLPSQPSRLSSDAETGTVKNDNKDGSRDGSRDGSKKQKHRKLPKKTQKRDRRDDVSKGRGGGETGDDKSTSDTLSNRPGNRPVDRPGDRPSDRPEPSQDGETTTHEIEI